MRSNHRHDKLTEHCHKCLCKNRNASHINDDVHQRLSVAKLMRLGELTVADQLRHLSPVVNEFFHLGMNRGVNFQDRLPYPGHYGMSVTGTHEVQGVS